MPLNLTPWGHQLHELLWDVVLAAEDLFGAAGSATVAGFLALGGGADFGTTVLAVFSLSRALP